MSLSGSTPSTRVSKPAISVRQITLFGVLGALTFAAKLVMSGLPNIEPVSLLVMVFASVMGFRCLYPIYIYVILENLVYGINTWSIAYLYVWAVLALLAVWMRKSESPLSWAMLSGAFGLCFGALCAPVTLFIGGPGYMVSWWISGIPWDLTHCIGNFVMALLLFRPLRALLTKLYRP